MQASDGVMIICMHTEGSGMSEDSDTTNIRIKTETWKRLRDKYKDTPGKTWDDVLQELLADAEEREEREDPNQNPPLTQTAD